MKLVFRNRPEDGERITQTLVDLAPNSAVDRKPVTEQGVYHIAEPNAHGRSEIIAMTSNQFDSFCPQAVQDYVCELVGQGRIDLVECTDPDVWVKAIAAAPESAIPSAAARAAHYSAVGQGERANTLELWVEK